MAPAISQIDSVQVQLRFAGPFRRLALMEGGTGIPRIRSGQVLLIAKVLAKWSAWASTSSLRVICEWR